MANTFHDAIAPLPLLLADNVKAMAPLLHIVLNAILGPGNMQQLLLSKMASNPTQIQTNNFGDPRMCHLPCVTHLIMLGSNGAIV
jgi:hypothetical protein